MKRRDIELFNLSFLDILSGALGAVLFLFIVVPKGDGEAPAAEPQLMVKYDTIQKKYFGDIPDSLIDKRVGDTLLAIVFDYDKMPNEIKCPEQKPCPDNSSLSRSVKRLEKSIRVKDAEISRLKSELNLKTKQVASASKTKPTPTPTIRESTRYKGDLPSVPCKLSIEAKWQNIDNNVDLFVCKEGSCVFGGKRKNSTIGFWDSGKSKTSFWGGDLRTTQEAVRQFDEIIPGDYEIYVQYKNAKEEPEAGITVNMLIYTNPEGAPENGKTLDVYVPFDENERLSIGSLTVNEDGTFNFSKSN